MNGNGDGYLGALRHGELEGFWGQNGNVPGCDLWAASLNHLNVPSLLLDLEGLPWEWPASAQVLIHEQNEYFVLWMFVDRRLSEVLLPGTESQRSN